MIDAAPCPACAEPVRSGTKKCPHCGERVAGSSGLWEGAPRRAGCLGPLLACLGMWPLSTFAFAQAVQGLQPVRMGGAEWLVVAAGFGGLLLGSFLSLRYGDPSRPAPGREGVTLATAFGALVATPLIVALLLWGIYSQVRRGPVGNQTAAIGALKTIHSAQELFKVADKEGDGNLDYGTLTELASSGTTGLVDSVLGSGTKNGYIFQATYCPTSSEFLWFAVAEPMDPDRDNRYFAVNQDGVTYYTTTEPFWLNDIDCTMPPGVREVGK